MEVIVVIVAIVTLLGLLDVAALRLGTDSRFDERDGRTVWGSWTDRPGGIAI